MGASHDDGDPSFLEFPRNLVGTGRYRCLGGKTYEVDLFIKVNLLIGLIDVISAGSRNSSVSDTVTVPFKKLRKS